MQRSSSFASSKTMGHESRCSTPLDDINRRRKADTRHDILSSRVGSRDGYLATPRFFSTTRLHTTPRVAPFKTTDDMFADLKTHMNQELEAEKAKVKALEAALAKQQIELSTKSNEVWRLRQKRDNAKNELTLSQSVRRNLRERLRQSERISTAAKNVVGAAWKEFGARMDELATAVKNDR